MEGRLEILYYGSWGTICHHSFGITNANVACRRLGFAAAKAHLTPLASSSSSIWLDNIQCVGNETAIEDCSHSGFNATSGCDHFYDDVKVICIGKYLAIYICCNCHNYVHNYVHTYMYMHVRTYVCMCILYVCFYTGVH